MTGRYPHRIGVYDNACSLSSDAVTWAHLLRASGYDVALAGKQHFVGPDQLHGFQAQLARDLHAEHRHPIYPWDDGIVDAKRPWPGPETAGPGSTESIETDDAVEAAAVEYVREPARAERPWALNVSFIAPHFPLVVPKRYWDRYPLDAVDLPTGSSGQVVHPVYQRMRRMFGLVDYPEAQVRRARAGYYALVTYLDDKIGRLLDALEETGQAEDTLVVYTSDHGEMNGEHGLWRKSNFYEDSARVPLIMRWPGRIPAGRRIGAGV
jgi:choline-sulfatase